MHATGPRCRPSRVQACTGVRWRAGKYAEAALGAHIISLRNERRDWKCQSINGPHTPCETIPKIRYDLSRETEGAYVSRKRPKGGKTGPSRPASRCGGPADHLSFRGA